MPSHYRSEADNQGERAENPGTIIFMTSLTLIHITISFVLHYISLLLEIGNLFKFSV